MSLNVAQREAVEAEGHSLVVACPGSGKTRLLIARAAHLLANPENKVIAVTFTRASAAELKQRAGRLIRDKTALERRFAAGTFHSLALSQLKKNGVRPHIIGRSALEDFVLRAREVSGVEIDGREAVQLVQRLKASMNRNGATAEEIRLLDAYQEILRRNSVLDMQDILRIAVERMAQNTISPIGCTHLLVDEFQDADPTQLAWVLAHASRGVLVTAVGDDDQAIYGFRCSMGYQGMTRLRDTLGAATFKLTTNYRSHAEILEHAVSIVGQVRGRIEKDIVAHRGAGGIVRTHVVPSQEDEARLIFETVRAEPASWAVLARTNEVLQQIEAEFSAYGVPFSRSQGSSFWELRPVAVMISILESLAKRQTYGVDRAMAYAGISEHDIQLLHPYLNNREKLATVDVQGKARKIALDLLDKFNTWRSLIDNPKRCIAGVLSWVIGCAREQSEEQVSWAEKAASSLCRLTGTIEQRLMVIASAAKGDNSNGVLLTTIHGSKGLEFRKVWIVGVEHEKLPSARADLNEERRLFYVAMTRAMDELHMSCGGKQSEFFTAIHRALNPI